MQPSRFLLEKAFAAAIAAVQPENILRPFLPDPPAGGRLIILAAGKAAGAMTAVAEQHYLDDLRLPREGVTGIAVTRTGYARPTRIIPVVEAGHPIPDAVGRAAATDTLNLADQAGADDLVLVLLSGGASANWTAPSSGIELAEKQAVTSALLRAGATIAEINTVRKHLSRIKGGRLVVRAAPARLVTLAISDVPGDDPAVIGSGPTVPDPSTLADAQAVLGRYGLDVPPAIRTALSTPDNETPKPNAPAFASATFQLIACPADALRAAQRIFQAAGYQACSLGDRVEGEASEVARRHAALALNCRDRGQTVAIVSGGELTVTLRGKGRGGPNQEYALALALALNGRAGIAAIAADTDGTDGGSGRADDPAGAVIDDRTLDRARALGLDPSAELSRNNSTALFSTLGDLVTPGPTYTNVNDFRAILVDSG